MTLNISDGNTNVIERGVYYYGLADYPNITVSDLRNVAAFVRYEKMHGRPAEIVCEDENILKAVNDALSNAGYMESAAPPSDEEEFVYHATGVRAAREILRGGRLLSAEKVFVKSAEELSFEKRDSLWNDPPDYFQYIMFCGGGNPTGDYVVLSENFPSEEDLSKGNFNAGARFYFRYRDIIRHPGHVFDGYHPVKVKDEIVLSEYLYACIAPQQYKDELDGRVLPEIAPKVYYLSQKGVGLTQWNEKVYDFVRNL